MLTFEEFAAKRSASELREIAINRCDWISRELKTVVANREELAILDPHPIRREILVAEIETTRGFVAELIRQIDDLLDYADKLDRPELSCEN